MHEKTRLTIDNNGDLNYILPQRSDLNKCLKTLTPASAIAQVERYRRVPVIKWAGKGGLTRFWGNLASIKRHLCIVRYLIRCV